MGLSGARRISKEQVCHIYGLVGNSIVWADARMKCTSHAPKFLVPIAIPRSQLLELTPISKYDLTMWFRHQRFQHHSISGSVILWVLVYSEILSFSSKIFRADSCFLEAFASFSFWHSTQCLDSSSFWRIVSRRLRRNNLEGVGEQLRIQCIVPSAIWCDGSKRCLCLREKASQVSNILRKQFIGRWYLFI
jgi:hypothetical protein